MRKNTQLCIALIILCFTEVRGQSVSSQRILTVDEAVRIALDKNLGLQRNALEIAGKKRTSDRSWNSLLPSLSVSAGMSHPRSITGSISPDRNNWTPGVSLSASFIVSTAVIENIKKARTDYEAGHLSYEMARRELELQVRKLFIRFCCYRPIRI